MYTNVVDDLGVLDGGLLLGGAAADLLNGVANVAEHLLSGLVLLVDRGRHRVMGGHM